VRTPVGGEIFIEISSISPKKRAGVILSNLVQNMVSEVTTKKPPRSRIDQNLSRLKNHAAKNVNFVPIHFIKTSKTPLRFYLRWTGESSGIKK